MWKTLCLLALLTATALFPAWADDDPVYPNRVLITNDNGIDDPKIVALARAFAPHSETWVVAPNQDRSGSGSYLSMLQAGEISFDKRDLGPGIHAMAVDGYPADCVLLALAGPMRKSLPDLVISGINGGANLGADWVFSGTIGAARVAAVAGIPSIAVSGLDDDLPGAVDAAVDWVVRLAGSSTVRSLRPGEYLTVSLPRTSPNEILGVRITDRAPLQKAPRLAAVEGKNAWRLVGIEELNRGIPIDSDQAASDDGYIAVVPMRIDEVDLHRLALWRRSEVDLPGWQPVEHQDR